jgi:hypothetical protein
MSVAHSNIKIFILRAIGFGSGFWPSSGLIEEERYRNKEEDN